MIEELNKIRNQVVLERKKFRENLSEYLKKHNLIIRDLAKEVSKNSGKSVANIYSRISSCYIDDELWEYIAKYLDSFKEFKFKHLNQEIAEQILEKMGGDEFLVKYKNRRYTDNHMVNFGCSFRECSKGLAPQNEGVWPFFEFLDWIDATKPNAHLTAEELFYEP